MKQYIDLVQHVLYTGTRKENRTGVDTLSTFGYYYEHDLRDGFPLLTTKAVSWKNIVVEMLWFLSGQTDIAILKRHGCKFWDAWADEKGKVPSAYGNFWRQFPVHGVHDSSDTEIDGEPCLAFNDQIRWVLDELRRNPMSRRMVVSAWAPGNAQTSKLPPCHCLFMLNVQNDDSKCDRPWEAVDSSYQDTQMLGVVWADTEDKAYELALHKYGQKYESMPDGEPMECLHVRRPMEHRIAEYIKGREPPKMTQRLCLHLTQRSCDVALGVPYNIASYALLLNLFSHLTGIEPGIFGHTLVDAHVYTAKPDGSKAEFDHVPGLKEQVRREPRKLPTLKIDPSIKSLEDIERLMGADVTTEEVMRHFVLEGYSPYEAINFKVAV
jgi:thymidylate synthase